MILDAGFLISVDRSERSAHAFLEAAARTGTDLHTTHPVVAQVWRDGSRQARLAAFLKIVHVHPLDDGPSVGLLLARSRTADVVDRAGLRQAITAFTARYRGRSLSEISLAIMLQQLLGILQQHQLHLPQETALLFKVLMMAEGTAARLDPDFQMLDALQPYAEQLTRAQLSLPALARRWARAGADTGALLTELPATLSRLRHLLEDGGFEVHLRATELGPLVGRAERVGARGVVAGPEIPVDVAASTTVPHCWHSPQRPIHFALVHPHSVQRYAKVVAARLDAMESG